MTATEQLCRDVAVEVMGMTEGNGQWADAEGCITMPLRTTWNDAGRVVEAMRARGYKLSCEQMWGAGRWSVTFGYMGGDIAFCDGAASAYTLPEAVSRAALQAVRGGNDNG